MKEKMSEEIEGRKRKGKEERKSIKEMKRKRKKKTRGKKVR